MADRLIDLDHANHRQWLVHEVGQRRPCDDPHRRETGLPTEKGSHEEVGRKQHDRYTSGVMGFVLALTQRNRGPEGLVRYVGRPVVRVLAVGLFFELSDRSGSVMRSRPASSCPTID